MRFHPRLTLAAALASAACSVPDKQEPLALDASTGDVDAPPVEPDAGPTDETAPDTMITSAPAMFSNMADAIFEFTSDEAGVTFECSVDGETPVPCSSPFRKTLGDGSHSFAVRATDSAGNSDDTPAEHLWTIDRAAPNTTLTRVPPANDNSVTVTFEFRSTEMNVSFECSLDNATYGACTSPAQIGPLADGQHTFAVRARDRAGNIDASPAIHAWRIDTSTPDTQIVSGPTGDVSSTTASFSFMSPDAGSGATFQCSLDGAAFTTCTSPRNLTGLAEGPHTFAVRVRDAVGNLDPTPATATWRVDLQEPNTTIASGPQGIVDSASATFTFTTNEQDATFECSLDGGAFAACTSPHTLSQLGQGDHTFAVRARDAAGHVDQSPATRSWTVDTVAPDIDITMGPAAGATVGPRVTFAFTVSEGAAQCSLDNAPFAACTSPLSFSLPAGNHEFRIRATDGAGNQTTVTRAFTVACTAPTPAGANGLLHLDEDAQVLANAVGGGATALLGDTDMVEPFDPAAFAAARFGGGLTFVAAEGDRVTWPAALGTTSTIAVELWSRPDSLSGARDVFVSGDGRFSLQVVAVTASTVRFTATVTQADGTQPRSVSSAAVAADVWHHVVVSLNPPNLTLWVDGQATAIDNATLDAGFALDSIRLGGADAVAYQGALDEIWVSKAPMASADAALARYCPMP